MFSDAIKTTGHYSDRDILLFEKEIKLKQVEKDEILLNKGEVAKSIFFILTGAIYQFNLTRDNDRSVIDLHIKNEWFLSHQSFISQIPSMNLIGAFTKSSVLELSIESIHYLIGQSPAFLQLNKIFENSTSRVYFFDNILTPLQKYQFLLENRPQLLQEFPLKIIASFLKITPETLSRVRGKFGKDKSFLDLNQVR